MECEGKEDMSIIKKPEIPMFIIGFVGIVTLLDYYIKVPLLNDAAKSMQQWAVIVTSMALGLALININIIQGKKVVNKSPGWIWSTYLLGLMWVMIIAGLFGTGNPVYTWLFDNIYSVVGATMWSLLAFFVVSAAFRAFRANSLESGLLLISAIFVSLERAPSSGAILEALPVIGSWILKVPNTAGMRAILMGTALGGISLAIRILTGREKSHLAIGREES